MVVGARGTMHGFRLWWILQSLRSGTIVFPRGVTTQRDRQICILAHLFCFVSNSTLFFLLTQADTIPRVLHSARRYWKADSIVFPSTMLLIAPSDSPSPRALRMRQETHLRDQR